MVSEDKVALIHALERCRDIEKERKRCEEVILSIARKYSVTIDLDRYTVMDWGKLE